MAGRSGRFQLGCRGYGSCWPTAMSGSVSTARPRYGKSAARRRRQPSWKHCCRHGRTTPQQPTTSWHASTGWAPPQSRRCRNSARSWPFPSGAAGSPASTTTRNYSASAAPSSDGSANPPRQCQPTYPHRGNPAQTPPSRSRSSPFSTRARTRRSVWTWPTGRSAIEFCRSGRSASENRGRSSGRVARKRQALAHRNAPGDDRDSTVRQALAGPAGARGSRISRLVSGTWTAAWVPVSRVAGQLTNCHQSVIN
jgi:hypothetical protein